MLFFFLKFKEMIYIGGIKSIYISGSFLLWVDINYPRSPLELTYFEIIFMRVPVATKLCNKDYKGP